ncbi:MAG: very short patch repair endonuclease [Candidatus Dormiibacterota bacterium]
MPDWLTPEQRSRNMSAIRSSGTSPERRLRKILKSLFPRRLLRERPDLPGRPDFFFPGLKLAVFADGCFWHGCPLHGHIPEDNRDYWEPKIARTRSRDKKAGRDLARLGVHSLRVWEHELSPTTVDQVVARIQRASRRAAHPRRVILAASRFAEPADGRKLAGPQI